MSISRKSKQFLIAALSASTAVLGFAGVADSATSTAQFAVNVNVVNACTIGFSGAISISTSSPYTGGNTMTVTCTSGAAYTVTLAGTPSTVTVNDYTFQTTDGANFIDYVVTGATTAGWTFADGSNRLGDDPTYNVANTGSGSAQTLALTATAASAGAHSILTAPAGDYTDTVTATVTF
jgi:spore coat protein U-like protein